MGVISWIVFGALAGWVASILTGNRDRMGCLTNIVVGVVGAAVGGLLMSLAGGNGISGFDLRSFVVAVVGAVVLLFGLGFLRGR